MAKINQSYGAWLNDVRIEVARLIDDMQGRLDEDDVSSNTQDDIAATCADLLAHIRVAREEAKERREYRFAVADPYAEFRLRKVDLV